MSILEVTFSGLLIFSGVGGPEASLVHVAKAPEHVAFITWLDKDSQPHFHLIQDTSALVFLDGETALSEPDIPDHSFLEAVPNLTTILGKTVFAGTFKVGPLATARLGGGRLLVPEGALRTQCGFRTAAGAPSGYENQLTGTVRWMAKLTAPALKGHLSDPTKSESLVGATGVRIENIPLVETVGTSHFGHYYDSSNLKYSAPPYSANLLHPCGLTPTRPGGKEEEHHAKPGFPLSAADKSKLTLRNTLDSGGPGKPAMLLRSNPLICPPVVM